MSFFSLDFFLFLTSEEHRNSFYQRYNIDIHFKRDSPKFVYTIRQIVITPKKLKKAFLGFIFFLLLMFLIVLVNINFSFENFDFNDWPLINNTTDFKKYYNSETEKEILNFYNEKFIGRYPNCLDLIIWLIFSTSFTLTFAIHSFRKYSILKFFTNVILSAFDAYSFIMIVIKINWIEEWDSSFVGFLCFITNTFYSFTFFSPACNIVTRTLSLLLYLYKSEDILGNNIFSCLMVFILYVYLAPLCIISLAFFFGFILTVLVTIPYFACSFIFILLPFYLCNLLGNLCTGLICIPIQLIVGIFFDFKETIKDWFTCKKVETCEKIKNCESLSNQELGTSDSFLENSFDFDDEKSVEKDFIFAFIETFIWIRFIYLFHILSLQFAILIFKGFNIFSSLKIFLGFPYFSSNFYSFKLQAYYTKFLNLIFKLSTLF
jgi:hypothetical protein